MSIWQLATPGRVANLTEYPQCVRRGCAVVGALGLQQHHTHQGPSQSKLGKNTEKERK